MVATIETENPERSLYFRLADPFFSQSSYNRGDRYRIKKNKQKKNQTIPRVTWIKQRFHNNVPCNKFWNQQKWK